MAADEYVQSDSRGLLRVGRAHVPMESVWIAFEQGHSPESIRSQYPVLELKEIYGAIAYGLSHPQVVGDYMERQAKLWDEGRRKSCERMSPAVKRLRSMDAASAIGEGR